LWYTLPGPTYFYLNITASIYLSGTLVAVIAGLFWSRASTLGGYMALGGGAVATIGFFFFKTPASYAGLGSFALAAVGMIVGSLLVKPRSSELMRPGVSTSS
jgi:Na+/proline symporter